MEFIISAILIVVALGAVAYFVLLNKKEREKVNEQVEEAVEQVQIDVADLKKMTKAKLGVFIAEHNLDIDLKQKKNDIIAEIKKKL